MRMSKNGRGKGKGRGVGGKVVPISRAAGSNAFAKLKALKAYKEVHQRLVDGWPLAEVARFIQQERGEYVDITKDGLVGILHKYRATIPAGEFAKHMPGAVVDKMAELQEGMDEMQEFVRLYRLQSERVEIDAQVERRIKKLLPTMTQEVRVLKDILSDYAQLKMDLGISERNLGTTNVNVTGEVAHYGNASVSKVMGNAESRRKLLGVVQNLINTAGSVEEAEKLLPAAAVDVEVVPTETKEMASEDMDPLEKALLDELEGGTDGGLDGDQE